MNIAQNPAELQTSNVFGDYFSNSQKAYRVAITIFKSLVDTTPMTKTYRVSGDGNFIKSDTGKVPVRSEAIRAEFTGAPATILSDFGTRLETLTRQEAIILAPEVRGRPECLVVRVKDLSEHPQAVTKTDKDFPTPVGPAIMGLDFDVSGWPQHVYQKISEHPDTLTGVLTAVYSGFADAAFIYRASASAHIKNRENGRTTGHPGQHRYYVITDGADAADFAKRLHERLVLAGYGFGKILKTGAVKIYSLIDVAATESYSRFWYESDAILDDPRLERTGDRRATLKHEFGGVLDASALLPLSDSERQRLDEIERQIAAELAPEAAKMRGQYLAARKEELIARGTKPEIADKILTLAVERHVLADDFQIELNDGTAVTAAEIFADPRRFDGLECPDPFEPEYGRSKAMIMLSSGTPHIKSYAHGGREFELYRDLSHWYEEPVTHATAATEPLFGNECEYPSTEGGASIGLEVVTGVIAPSTIPVRNYVVSPRLPRGEVYQLIGEPGAGKSQMNLLDALAIATGREDILRGKDRKSPERLHSSGPVLVYNAEDKLDEMKRRLIALQRHFGVTPEDMRHPVLLWSGVGAGNTLTLMERRGRDPLKQTAGYENLRKVIKEHQVVMAFLDPQISLASGIDENSNDDMNALLQAIASLASATNCCIGVTHHTSKQRRQSAGDMGAGRGAFAQAGKVRSAYTLTRVTGDDDIEKGLTGEIGLVRLENAKLSYSAKDRPAFYRKVSVKIGNGTGLGSDHPFAGEELSPREQLLLAGDQAPVLEIVDISDLQAQAATKKKPRNGEVIARIVDEVMGDGDRIELPAWWEVIGSKMRGAGLSTAKTRNVISGDVVAPLTGNGQEFERDGQIVRIRAVKKSENQTSPWVLTRDLVGAP